MRDIRESPNATSGPKALFGGQDLADKFRIWFNNVGFALCIKKTKSNCTGTDLFKLKDIDYLIVDNKVE